MSTPLFPAYLPRGAVSPEAIAETLEGLLAEAPLARLGASGVSR
jgi:hypothetical protein